MKRTYGLILLANLAALPAWAYPAKDQLVCELTNGDRFELVSTFDYAISLLRGNQRENIEPFRARYKPAGGRFWHKTDVEIDRREWGLIANESARRMMCARFASFGGVLNASGLRRLPGEKQFETVWLPRGTYDRIAEILRNSGYRLLYEPVSYLGMAGHELVMEEVVVKQLAPDEQAPIEAVIQHRSTDGGKSWSDPVITTDSRWLQIGKPLLEQPGIARPVSFKVGPLPE